MCNNHFRQIVLIIRDGRSEHWLITEPQVWLVTWYCEPLALLLLQMSLKKFNDYFSNDFRVSILLKVFELLRLFKNVKIIQAYIFEGIKVRLGWISLDKTLPSHQVRSTQYLPGSWMGLVLHLEQTSRCIDLSVRMNYCCCSHCQQCTYPTHHQMLDHNLKTCRLHVTGFSPCS